MDSAQAESRAARGGRPYACLFHYYLPLIPQYGNIFFDHRARKTNDRICTNSSRRLDATDKGQVKQAHWIQPNLPAFRSQWCHRHSWMRLRKAGALPMAAITAATKQCRSYRNWRKKIIYIVRVKNGLWRMASARTCIPTEA